MKQTVAPDTIPGLLIRDLPRDLIMGVDDALQAGAVRALEVARGMHDGHKASVLGQMRHFHMNEAFAEALAGTGANPTPIRGNSIVIGRSGVFSLSRFNVSGGVWNNGRRSRTRREMAMANRVIEPMVLPDLFDMKEPITVATAFFVAAFSGSVLVSPECPLSIEIAVPDSAMQGWLFREPLNRFLSRYEAVPEQVDTALPRLKKNIKKQDGGVG